MRAIGRYCFRNSALESVWTPGSLRELGEGAFSGCARLRLAVLNEGLEELGRQETLICDGEGVFQQSGVETVVLPSTLRKLGSFAFCECVNLKNLRLPPGLASVGKFCFAHSGLEELTLPDSLRTLEHNALAECRRLRTVYAQNGCADLAAAGLPECARVVHLPADVGL